MHNHMYLDNIAYQPQSIEQEIIKRGHVSYILYKMRSKEERDCMSTETQNYEKLKMDCCREQIHGTIGSENCLQDIKRKQKITSDWYNYHAVSLSGMFSIFDLK
jgi:hypothetical protein